MQINYDLKKNELSDKLHYIFERKNMRTLNISQIDTVFANGSYPIEFLIYFKNKLNTSKIRKSLRESALLFWPAFGKYSSGKIVFSSFNEDENFDELHSDKNFDANAEAGAIFEQYKNSIPVEVPTLFYL